MDRPKLSTSVWLSIACVAWVSFSAIMVTKLTRDPIFIAAVVVISIILIAAAGVNWWYWMRFENSELELHHRRVESVTPFTEAADRVLHMDKTQLDFLGMHGYHAMIGVIGTRNGPTQVLLTPWGNVPLHIVRRELRRSGLIRLPKIRDYSDGSLEREYLRIIIKWAVDAGLAHDPNGNEPAMWIDKDSRNIAAGMLGLDLYEAQPESEDE